MVNTVIVVPVHNAPQESVNLLMYLHHEHKDVPVVVVDDASEKETTGAIIPLIRGDGSGMRREWDYLRNDRQQLFTRTVNRGLRHALQTWGPDTVTFVNTDVKLKPGWLDALITPFYCQDKVGIVGFPDDPQLPDPEEECIPFERRYQQVFPPQFVTGHCFSVNTQVFRDVGVFCETDTDGRFTPELAQFHGQAHIGSERMLCWRAAAAGYQNYNVHLPLCEHGTGASWNRDLSWLANLKPQWLWEPNDSLTEPVIWTE